MVSSHLVVYRLVHVLELANLNKATFFYTSGIFSFYFLLDHLFHVLCVLYLHLLLRWFIKLESNDHLCWTWI